jgi:hypothetical protein
MVKAEGPVKVVAGPEVTMTIAEVLAGTAGSRVTAVIRWTTDRECGTRVRYGLDPESLDRRAGEGVAVQHAVTLTDLEPGRTYHYAIGTARMRLREGSFTTEVGKGGARTKAPAPKELPPEARAPMPPRGPPPARASWGHLPSLQDHYERHGADFGSRNAEEYARQAWEFLQRAMAEGLPAKLDEREGTIRVYDPKTGAFAAYNRNGTTKTYFKPGSPDYWQRQPGRMVRLRPQPPSTL